MPILDNYSLFFQFIDNFLMDGFLNIDRSDPLILQLEQMTEANNQFFYIGDLLQLKIIFTSQGSLKLLGVEPEKIDPYVFFTYTHSDDLQRHNIGRTKLFNLGQELYIKNSGRILLSTNFRFKDYCGKYSEYLVQCYLFFTEVPYKTVFLLQVNTDISSFKKIKHGYHFYLGDDFRNFRYPDENLLGMGNIFSDREFEITKLIYSGLESGQIAEKLFLSIHTVNTHRRNILKKSGKSNLMELVLDLKYRGML